MQRKENFESEIKAARKQKGLTQKALAEKIGINKTHIARAENDIYCVSVSKLRNIVENGLGGEMKMSVKF